MPLSLARKQSILGTGSSRKSLSDFAIDLAVLPGMIEQATVEATSKAALIVTNSARDQIRTASGGDNVLSHVGKRGSRVGARFDVKGTHNPTALVRAFGPLQLIERDTKPHTILPAGVGRATGRSKGARRAAKQELFNALFGGSFSARGSKAVPLRTPYGPRYRVQHPGTTGKHPFEKGVTAVQHKVPKVYQDALKRAMARAFR